MFVMVWTKDCGVWCVVLQDYQVTCCCISVGVLGLVTLVRPITISNIPLIKSFGDWRELDHNDMSSDG